MEKYLHMILLCIIIIISSHKKIENGRMKKEKKYEKNIIKSIRDLITFACTDWYIQVKYLNKLNLKLWKKRKDDEDGDDEGGASSKCRERIFLLLE